MKCPYTKCISCMYPLLGISHKSNLIHAHLHVQLLFPVHMHCDLYEDYAKANLLFGGGYKSF